MNTPSSQPLADRPEEAVDRYLDGLMAAEERAAFEVRLADDPALRAHVERQRLIDTALRDYARPPSPNRILATIREYPAASDSSVVHTADQPQLRLRIPPAWRRLAVAAVLILGVIGAWQVASVLRGGPSGKYDPGPHRTMIQAYHDTVDNGFKATWICDSDAVFALVFKDTFGQMLSMNLPLPPNTTANGLNPFDIFSKKTVGMLARVSDQPVMIFVDRIENDRGTQPTEQDGLHVFRRKIGSLVLYEVTPLDTPSLLNHLVEPDELPANGGAPQP